MRVSVFGLGYVGSVLTACLSRAGHEVVGVDVNPQKVAAVEAGEAPVEEPGVGERFDRGVSAGRIEATTDAGAAVADSRLSFLTVGTPLDDSGQLNTTNLYNVVDSVADALGGVDEHALVVRSTVPPGTTASLRSYLAGTAGEAVADRVPVVANPEFLREGSAVEDFHDPPYVVLGVEDAAPEALLSLFDSLGLADRVRVVDPPVAESLKMVNNAFHALKVCFANEVGSIASAAGVDGRELLSLVREDTKLNVSAAYLEPGFAFGGSCLPKDTRAVATLGRSAGVEPSLLESVPRSNEAVLDRVADRVADVEGEGVGLVGASFKSDTADLRNSPALRLARRLDREVLVYDEDLDLDAVVGSNRDYLERTFPDLEEHLVEDLDAFLDATDVLVFTNGAGGAPVGPHLDGHAVFDPVGALADRADDLEEYHTVTW